MYRPLVVLLALAACSNPSTDALRSPPDSVRVVLFGDSNTDYGWSDSIAAAHPDNSIAGLVALTYVSVSEYPTIRLGPHDPNHPTQISGKIEALWKGAGIPNPIRVVNHAIGGTNTTDTRSVLNDEPNALYKVNGVTRFEGQVLGLAYPWTFDGRDHVAAVQAFQPTPHDFVYISLGTNDCRYGTAYRGTVDNLKSMVDRWTAAGLPPSHVLLATIPPTTDSPICPTARINDEIRAMIQATGATLIDLAAYTTAPDGIHWKDPNMSATVPEDVHYKEWVRAWIAGQIVAKMR